MKLTLDRLAIRELLEKHEDVAFDLSKAVANEALRNFAERDAVRLLERADKEVLALARKAIGDEKEFAHKVAHQIRAELTEQSGGTWGRVSASERVKQAVDSAVTETINKAVREAKASTTSIIEPLIQEKLQAYVDDDKLEARINRRVEMLVNSHIYDRVDEAVKQRLADVSDMIGAGAASDNRTR
jgi:uncharacterized membrane protein YheB (UPF0754 family)